MVAEIGLHIFLAGHEILEELRPLLSGLDGGSPDALGIRGGRISSQLGGRVCIDLFDIVEVIECWVEAASLGVKFKYFIGVDHSVLATLERQICLDSSCFDFLSETYWERVVDIMSLVKFEYILGVLISDSSYPEKISSARCLFGQLMQLVCF